MSSGLSINSTNSATIFRVANKTDFSLAGKASIHGARDKNTDAVKVTISESSPDITANNSKRGIEAAKDFVSTARSAASAISSVLKEAQKTVEQIQKTTNPREQQALAQESELLIGEIDTIIAAAKSNDEPVVNAGSVTFSSQLTPSAQSNSNEVSILVNNIALSPTDLGLGSFSGDSAISDTDASLEQIETAQLAVAASDAELRGTSQEIESLESGSGQSNQIPSSNLNQNDNGSAQTLSSVIANHTSSFLSQNSSNEATVVKTLIDLQA